MKIILVLFAVLAMIGMALSNQTAKKAGGFFFALIVISGIFAVLIAIAIFTGRV
jgi:hypothetical protein